MSYPAPFNDQQIADQLTRDGLHWNATTLTYTFDNFSTGGNALDATHELWIERAITFIEEMFDLEFTRLSSGVGDITFNGTAGNGTYASTNYWPSSGNIAYVDIHFDQNWSSNQSSNLSYGSYGLTTIIHEFLHALGLDHPGNYNAGEGGPITYLDDAEFLQDTHRYTVMSYFDSFEDGSASAFFDYDDWSFLYPQTPMVYDILAMTEGSFDGKFAGYGLNTSTRTGDTVYGYNASAGLNEVYDFDINGTPVLTIHDGGGTDTLDVSGDTVSNNIAFTYNGDGSVANMSVVARTISTIDIREGQYSSTHGMVNNIGIAFGTVIENVVTGSLDDTIYGNDVGNVINAGAGSNTIFGFDGDDTFIGGIGADHMDGGDGVDTVDYSGAATRIVASLISGAGSAGDASGDTFTQVENLIGGTIGDVLIGDNGSNELTGNQGSDALYGRFGDDVLFGGIGHDLLNGGAGADQLYGGDGIDRVSYQGGMAAGVTVDLVNGGSGDVGSHAIGDTYDSIENVVGSNLNDIIIGNDTDNLFVGANGDDVLVGLGGRDVLIGGLGSDTFRFVSETDSATGFADRDQILDFGYGGDDLIDFSPIDAVAGGGDDAFSFIGTSGFSQTAGELRYLQQAGFNVTIVEADLNGDGIADMQVQLSGLFAFDQGDFIL